MNRPEPPSVLVETRGNVALVTIDRPEALNALNQSTICQLQATFSDIARDRSVLGAVITGSGSKAFAAGADISEIASATPADAAAFTRAGQHLMDTIENLGKPVVAAVNGFALGGGCELALACSMRLCTPNARFGQPEVRLGLVPGYGGSQRLPTLVGKGRAMQMILTGEPVDAQEAHRIGLVNEVVEPDTLLTRAVALLDIIAGNGPMAVRFAMEAVNASTDTPMAHGLAYERSLFALCVGSEDGLEGTRAFLEKRRPSFKGR